VKTLFGIIGAVIGAVFGLIAAVAMVRLLSHGNTLGEGFLLLVAAPLGILAGAVTGAAVTVRIAPHLRERPTSDAGQRSRKRLILGLLLGIPAAFVVVVWVAREMVEPPSDSAMLRHFERQEVTFDKLVEMAGSDKGLVRVDVDWTMPADTQSVGVSRERVAAYRKLLRDAGTPRGFKVSPENAGYDFYFWLRGSAISDDVTKGFAYRTSPPPIIVQTLDGIHADPGKELVAYRHIRGNWYLFYEFIPD
jgi:hypothetical protein